jgi:glycosyltransferase involved in cell wall biosynthesis
MIIGIDGNEANIKNRVGSGVYAFEIIKNLYQVDQKNIYKIYLKQKPIDDLPSEKTNWQYLNFGLKKLWTQFALPLKLLADRPKPDVFFTPGHYAPRFSNIPQVITIFDLSFIRFPQMFQKKDLYQLTNWTKYSVYKSNAIITISNFSKKEIVDYYQIDPQKVHVIYPGYDNSLFESVSDQKLIQNVKQKYKIKKDYLLFVGTIQPRKNLIKLIEAFKLLDKKYDLQLVIAGKWGWLYEEFFSEANEMKGKVVICDFVKRSDLPVLYSQAKAFVLPSLYEGFGIPVVEAQSCGVPVVVANTSSLPEVVGESGILIDPKSADSIAQGINKILIDEKLKNEIIKKGYENVKRFSWQSCTKQTLNVLENLNLY